MKKKISLSSISDVIESVSTKHLSDVPIHIREQVWYRTVMAKDCVLNKECLYCGCSMTGTLDKRFIVGACDKKYKGLEYCYDELMSDLQWEVFKKTIDFEDIKIMALAITKDLPKLINK
jgi:hypothetical protein